MRTLSWLGAILVLIAVGIATASMLRVHSDTARPVAAAQPLVAAPSSTDPGPAFQGRTPRRSPRPSPVPTAAPAPPRAAPPAAPPAAPAIVIGSTQQALINQDRASAGLGRLTWSSCLASIAASNAQRMARQGYISHTNGPTRDLGCGLGSRAGENVGYWTGGVNDGQLNSMFINSPDHRANIMGPYHYVATAWAIGANGTAYIAVEFS